VVDANGNYCLLNIRSGGPYMIEYRMVGFQTIKQEGVVARLGENKVLNAQMRK